MSPFRKWKRHQRRPSPLWSSPHKHPIKVPDNYKPLPSISSRVFKLNGILCPRRTPSNTTRGRNLSRQNVCNSNRLQRKQWISAARTAPQGLSLCFMSSDSTYSNLTMNPLCFIMDVSLLSSPPPPESDGTLVQDLESVRKDVPFNFFFPVMSSR